MSPSDLSWLQGCLFFFLGVGVSYFFYWCQNRRTKRWTSDIESNSSNLKKRSATTRFNDAQSLGSDAEARSPSNLSNSFGEAMAFTGSSRSPDRNGLRSESLGRPRSLLKPSPETRKASHLLESVAQAETPNLARRETPYSTIVADRTPSPTSSPTAALLRPSGGEDESMPTRPPKRFAATRPRKLEDIQYPSGQFKGGLPFYLKGEH